jgi:uncharacterized protein
MTRWMPAVAVLIALALSTQTGEIGRALMPEPPFGLAITRTTLVALFDVALLLGAVRLAGVRPGPAWGSVGLSGAPVRGPLLAALAIFAPATVIAHVLAGGVAPIELQSFAWGAIGAPVSEEILYRGLALGVMVRICGLPFWPSLFAPALIFGLAHLWQGETLADTLGVVAITGIGGLFFGWLWRAWGWNLWPPILAHAGLNALWSLYDLGSNAVGGLEGNLLRIGVIIGWIVATLLFVRRVGGAVRS